MHQIVETLVKWGKLRVDSTGSYDEICRECEIGPRKRCPRRRCELGCCGGMLDPAPEAVTSSRRVLTAHPCSP